jgi:hypothetical protein
MRKANKPPSEWLRLLCRDWARENEVLVETADAKFLDYKPYLKGLLSPQLLYRLSIPITKESLDGTVTQSSIDFWGILGIEDDFDKAYIIAQIERFCSLFNVRGVSSNDDNPFSHDVHSPDPTSLAVAAAAEINASIDGGGLHLQNFAFPGGISKMPGSPIAHASKTHRQEVDTSKTTDIGRRQSPRREEKRLFSESKDKKARDREQVALQKAAERAEREAEREARRRKKIDIRDQREKFAQEQKEAALKRAAELVASNRVPIEITRGSQAVKSVVLASPTSRASPQVDTEPKKMRSAIVVSTAGDLHAIVTHSKNLWAKYNAIAKEHNQKVNWITIAKELGIHVKVREKYARMHSRAEQRGFDWEANSDWKVKDHPEIFLEPTLAEQKAKMSLPPLQIERTVLIENNKEVTDEAVAAAAAVVDASVTAPPVDTVVQTTDEHHGTAAAIAATSLVADPTAEFAESVDV